MEYFKICIILALTAICLGHNLRNGRTGRQGGSRPGQGTSGGSGSDMVEFYKLLVRSALRKAEQTIINYFDSRNNATASPGSSDFDLNLVHGRRKVGGSNRITLESIELNALIIEQTAIELEKETGIKLDELKTSLDFQKGFAEAVNRFCPPRPNKICGSDTKFRSADGLCNNLINKNWGSILTSQGRFLSPVYEDGIRSPRSSSVTGVPLPSPRLISNNIMKNTSRSVFDHRYTIVHMAWGQFIDHDMVLTPTSEANGGATIVDCCTTEDPERIECNPISIPSNDGHFTTTCMNFVRSTAGYVHGGCEPGKREQINGITSFIDASMVYGSSKEEMDALRSGIGGLMNVSEIDLPPPDSDDVCVLDHTGEFCLKAGDVRVNVVPHLQALHTLFLREHNRIAKILSELNTNWDDEKIFSNTRKIVGALIQHITYNEYLPILLGDDGMNEHQLNVGTGDSYDDTVNPSIKNAFASAAFRFGHSTVPKHQVYLLSDYTTMERFDMEDTFLNPHLVVQQNGQRLPDLSRWMCSAPAYEVDRIIEKSVRDALFKDSAGHSFDLAALNIQRGRDHGLPPYNEWRDFCGLSKATHFGTGDGGLINHNEENAQLLANTYSDVDDIDLYVGALTENHANGSIVGPTFACIIGKQFTDLKKGDRFWYERTNVNAGFSSDQLAEIKKVRLSKVLCNNFGMGQIQPEVFKSVSSGNELNSCSSYEDIDLVKWQGRSN